MKCVYALDVELHPCEASEHIQLDQSTVLCELSAVLCELSADAAKFNGLSVLRDSSRTTWLQRQTEHPAATGCAALIPDEDHRWASRHIVGWCARRRITGSEFLGAFCVGGVVSYCGSVGRM